MRRGSGTRSWSSMLRTARAAVGVLVLGGLALTVPPQTWDMLAFLDDERVWGWVSFQLSLIVLGLSAWYWSRAALAARFGIPDGQRTPGPQAAPDFGFGAFVWVPRLTVAATFLIGIAIAWLGHSRQAAVTAGVVGLGALAFTIFRPHPSMARQAAAVQFGVAGVGKSASRFRSLLAHAPYGPRVAWVVLVAGILPFVIGLIDSFSFFLHAPNILALLFPGPGIVLLLLGLMIGPLTCLTFVSDGMCWQFTLRGLVVGPRRAPILALLAIYIFGLVPYFDQHLHVVRTVPATANRQDLGQLFQAWTAACGGSGEVIRPVIVDMSGGATRAGLWGAAVLDRVLAARSADGPALFAISSVSGGSLGAAAAMSVLQQQNLPCQAQGLAKLHPDDSDKTKPVPLAGDVVGPLLGGWLMDDTPRAIFAPLAALLRYQFKLHGDGGGDSAQVIEQAFADQWSRADQPDGAPAWSGHFLSLFYDDGSVYRKGMPLWIANGTDATTGNRVITSPILAPTERKPAPEWPFRGARDFASLTGADVEIETAINNTARFPYLEPFGNMFTADGAHRAAALIDGGYFENEGIQTALELAAWLESHAPAGRKVEPIIVQATADGEDATKVEQVMRCGAPSDGAWIWVEQSALPQIFAPIAGLYHVRGGHSAVLLRQAYDNFCAPPEHPEQPQRFFNFYLPGFEERDIPLNWVLSHDVATFIWEGAFGQTKVDNNAELLALTKTMQSK